MTNTLERSLTIKNKDSSVPIQVVGDVRDIIAARRGSNVTNLPNSGVYGMGYINDGEGFIWGGSEKHDENYVAFRPTSSSWTQESNPIEFITNNEFKKIEKGTMDMPYGFTISTSTTRNDIFAEVTYTGDPISGSELLDYIEKMLPDGHYTIIGKIKSNELATCFITKPLNDGVTLINLEGDDHKRINNGKIADGRWPVVTYKTNLDEERLGLHYSKEKNPDKFEYGMDSSMDVKVVGVFYNFCEENALAELGGKRTTELFENENKVAKKLHYLHPAVSAENVRSLKHFHGCGLVDGNRQNIFHLLLENSEIAEVNLKIYRNLQVNLT